MTLAVGPFGKRSNLINLILPLIFLIFTTIELTINLNFNTAEMRYGMFVSKFIFLNHGHIFLTLLMPVFFKDIAEWNRNGKTLMMPPFVSLGLFWLFFFATYYYAQRINLELKNLVLLSFALGLFHNVFQAYGIINLYRARGEYKAQLTKPIKFLFFAFAAVAIASSEIFPRNFEIFEVLQPFLIGSSLFLCGLIIFLLYREEPNNYQKLICSLRLFLIALSPVSYIAVIGYLSVHGIEYFLIYTKMNIASHQEQKTKLLWIGIGSVLLVVLLSVPRLYMFEVFNVKFEALYNHIIYAFLFSCNMTHYLADGLIFRFKNAENRRFVLKALGL